MRKLNSFALFLFVILFALPGLAWSQESNFELEECNEEFIRYRVTDAETDPTYGNNGGHSLWFPKLFGEDYVTFSFDSDEAESENEEETFGYFDIFTDGSGGRLHGIAKVRFPRGIENEYNPYEGTLWAIDIPLKFVDTERFKLEFKNRELQLSLTEFWQYMEIVSVEEADFYERERGHHLVMLSNPCETEESDYIDLTQVSNHDLQIGKGANSKNIRYGASSWYYYQGFLACLESAFEEESHGDININLDLTCAPSEPVRIFISKVEYDTTAEAFFAVFGYLNENPATVVIPVGTNNRFNGEIQNEGQPEYFLPGRVDSAFRTQITGVNKVWTLKSPNGSTRTSTAPDKVNLSPVLEDSEVANGGNFQRFDPVTEKYIADFGYNNPFPYPVIIPVGAQNKFTGVEDRGQPTIFEPGRQVKVFEVPLDPGQQTVWTLSGRTSTADAPDEAPDTGIEDAGGVQGTNPDTTVVNEETTDIIEDFDNRETNSQDTILDVFQVSDTVIDGERVLNKVTLDFQFANKNNLLAAFSILEQAGLITKDDTINNGGLNKLTIQVTSEIALLLKDDEALELINPTLINELIESVEIPLRPFTNNDFVIISQGDGAQRSDFVRNGYNLQGRGVTIGILSDSYNNLNGVGDDGELPSEGVTVLKDFAGADEGRAMAEIIYDIAPGASLKFHTAFVSEGDFAEGIRALAAAGCDMIVDDVTYPAAPVFSEGEISQAVSDVVEDGVIYFTSAGNFSDQAYEGVFTAASSIPSGLSFPAGVEVHDNGGSVFQDIMLGAGTHIIGLQWDNDFITNEIGGGPNTGSTDDLDIYVYTESGILAADANKNNIGNDPFEFVVFQLSEAATVRIVVSRKSGATANLDFKYIFFRTNGFSFVNEGAGTNASTIFGHAANPDAITVAAVPYFNTAKLESFSSKGFGSISSGLKPDYTSVDGGNNTFFGFDFEGDFIPNFFGTSAAAPHLTGIAALLSEGFDTLTFAGNMSRADLISTFDTKLVDIVDSDKGAGSGPDVFSGKGFVRADSVLLNLGNPKPEVTGLDLSNENDTEGMFELIIEGSGFVEGQSGVLVGGDTIMASEVMDDSLIQVMVDTGLGSTPIQVFNNSVSETGADGGLSDVITAEDVFFVVSVTVKDFVKTYLEPVPGFEVSFDIQPTIKGNDLELQLTSADTSFLESLFANTSAFSTDLADTSSIGFYRVDFDPEALPLTDFTEAQRERFGFDVEPGLAVVQPLQLTLSVNNFSLKEGDLIFPELEYSLDGDFSAITAVDKQKLLDSILAIYEKTLAEGVVIANFGRAIVNEPGSPIDPAALKNYSQLISDNALNEADEESGEKIVEVDGQNIIDLLADEDAVTGISNFGRAIVNGNRLFDELEELQLGYDREGDEPGSNLGRAIVNLGRAIVNLGRAIVNEGEVIELSDDEAVLNFARAIVNDVEPSDELVLNFARAIVNTGYVETDTDPESVANFARAIVNFGRAIVNEDGSTLDVSALANFARAIVNNPSDQDAISNFGRAIVNFGRAIVNLGAGRAIVNFRGRAIVNGKGNSSDNPFFVILSIDDTTGTDTESERTFNSIPMATGNTVGQHVVTPGGVVLTSLFARAIVNTDEGSDEVSIPLGNFEFVIESGIMTVEPGGFQGPGIEAFAWNDKDADGIQDPEETEGVNNVTVRLLDASNGKELQKKTTNGEGKVIFRNVPFDKPLRLQFLDRDKHARTFPNRGEDEGLDSDANRNNGKTGTFRLTAENNYLVTNQDVGLFAPGKIVATVWNDENADGVLGEEEEGRVNNVSVRLLNANNGKELQKKTTNGQGIVTFNGVPTDIKVRLQFQDRDKHERTTQNQGTDTALDSDANRNNGKTGAVQIIGGSQTIDTLDMGLFAPGTIIATVWNDEDADGVLDEEETGRVNNVSVRLLNANNGKELQKKTTNGEGKVTFNGVPTDIKVRLQFQDRDKHARTYQNQGIDTGLDSDANRNDGKTGAIKIIGGSQTIDTLDMGLFAPGTIVATVWNDEDADGVLGEEEEGRVNNVSVRLLNASNGKELQKKTTNGQGMVTFNGVPTDIPVRLQFQGRNKHARTLQNQGTDTDLDSDANRNDGKTGSIRIVGGSRIIDTLDMGLFAPGKVVATVWNDANGNGIQDGDEAGRINKVTVRLLNANNGKELQKKTTNNQGVVTFNGVPTDIALRLQFGTKDGFGFTLANQGADDAVDSDAKVSDGKTAKFQLTQGSQEVDIWDAGLIANMGNVESMTSIRAEESNETVLEEGDFSLFPNPVRDLVYLKVPAGISGKAQISVMDGIGRLVTSFQATLNGGEQVELNFNTMEKGVYFVQIRVQDTMRLFKVLKN